MLSRLRRWPTCANVARIGLAAGLLGLASSVALAASHPAIRMHSEDRDCGCTAQREAQRGRGRAWPWPLHPPRWLGGLLRVWLGIGHRLRRLRCWSGRRDRHSITRRTCLPAPVAEGLAKLKPILIAHGWKVLSCQGETFTDLGQGGPGTGIAWRGGKLDFVQIDAGGSVGDACLPL